MGKADYILDELIAMVKNDSDIAKELDSMNLRFDLVRLVSNFGSNNVDEILKGCRKLESYILYGTGENFINK